jgi:hypothetical protein
MIGFFFLTLKINPFILNYYLLILKKEIEFMTRQEMEKNIEEIWGLFQETAERFKET